MKNIMFVVVAVVVMATPVNAQMSASATFENTYSRSVRDACRAQFRSAEDRLACAQYVVSQQRQDLLIESQIEANKAAAELDRERAEWLRDNPDRPYPRKRQ